MLEAGVLGIAPRQHPLVREHHGLGPQRRGELQALGLGPVGVRVEVAKSRDELGRRTRAARMLRLAMSSPPLDLELGRMRGIEPAFPLATSSR